MNFDAELKLFENLKKFKAFRAMPDGSCSCGNPACNAVGKHPVGPWKNNSSSDDIDLELFNIAIPTGSINKIVVIDVDPKNGGQESFLNLEKKLGKSLPDTWRVNTPSGGFHLYFQTDEKFKTCHGKLGEGIDFQAEGAYVIGAGSMHKLGNKYVWDDDLNPKCSVIESLPDELIKLLEPIKEVSNSIVNDYISDDTMIEIEIALKKIDSQSVNYQEWLNVGMALHSISNKADLPFELWDEWSSKDSDRYNGTSELLKKWASFRKNGNVSHKKIFFIAKEKGISPETIRLEAISLLNKDTGPDVDFVEPKYKPQTQEESPLPPKGTLAYQLCQEFIKAIPQTPTSVSIALMTQALPAMIFQDLIKTAQRTSVSSFFILNGKQGCGKSTVINGLIRVYDHIVGEENTKSIGVPASGIALRQQLAAKGGVGILINEELLGWLGQLRKSHTGKNGLSDAMLQLWSMTESGRLEAQHAADEKYQSKPIASPALSMIGGGVEKDWQELLNDRLFMTSGFGTRIESASWGKLIWHDDSVYDLRLNENESLVHALEQVKNVYTKLISLGYCNSKRYSVPISRDAKESVFIPYAKICHEEQNYKAYDMGLNRTRCPEIAIRIATRVAALNSKPSISRVFEGLEIGPELMQWAINLADISFKRMVQSADEENTPEFIFTSRLLEELRTNKRLTRTDIARGVGRKFPSHIRKGMIAELIESGEICLSGKFLSLPKKP